MATKDQCLFFKDKQNLVINDNLNGCFKNLNLNQNNYLSYADVVKLGDNKKFSNYDYSHNNDSQTRQNSTSFGKSKLTSTFGNSNLQNDYGKKEESKKEKTFNANRSTLSLHITAYENSIDAIFGDTINGERNERNKKKENISSIKSWKAVKKLFNDTSSSIKYAFDLPRQQKEIDANDPEVMQFKESQRLSNINQPLNQPKDPQCQNIFGSTLILQQYKRPKEGKRKAQIYFLIWFNNICYRHRREQRYGPQKWRCGCDHGYTFIDEQNQTIISFSKRK